MTNVRLQDVESSQISAIGHDPATQTLAVRFKTWKGEQSSLYHYRNVTAEQFAAMRDAESIGRHFRTEIKAFPERHPYERIEDRPGVTAQPRVTA